MTFLKSIYQFVGWTFAFVRLKPIQNPETIATPATDATPSLDDDWADIAVQLAEETKYLGLGKNREAFCASFAPSGDDQSENKKGNDHA